MTLFLSIINIGVLVLVFQEQSLAETITTTADSFSSTAKTSTSKDAVHGEPFAKECNGTMSEPKNGPNKVCQQHLVEDASKKVVLKKVPLEEEEPKADEDIAKYNPIKLSDKPLVEDVRKKVVFPKVPSEEGKTEADKGIAKYDSIKVSEEPLVEEASTKDVLKKVPSEEEEPKANEDIVNNDPFSILQQDGIFEDYGYPAGEDEERKSSGSNSNGRDHRYGETIERKFSNGQISYGEKSGFESGRNLEFGVGHNRATGARGVGISVSKGFINGHGVGIAFGNGDKSTMSGERVERNVPPEFEEDSLFEHAFAKQKALFNKQVNNGSDEISEADREFAKEGEQHTEKKLRKNRNSNKRVKSSSSNQSEEVTLIRLKAPSGGAFKIDLSSTGIVISIGAFFVLFIL